MSLLSIHDLYHLRVSVRARSRCQIGIQFSLVLAFEQSSFKREASCGWYLLSFVHEASSPQFLERISTTLETVDTSSKLGPKFHPSEKSLGDSINL